MEFDGTLDEFEDVRFLLTDFLPEDFLEVDGARGEMEASLSESEQDSSSKLEYVVMSIRGLMTLPLEVIVAEDFVLGGILCWRLIRLFLKLVSKILIVIG